MEKQKYLKNKYLQLQKRLKKLEAEMKQPLKKNDDDNALDEERLDIVHRLYQVEKDNLERVTKELSQHL